MEEIIATAVDKITKEDLEKNLKEFRKQVETFNVMF